MSNKIAVIGLGNLLLRDEGVGIHALRLLRKKHSNLSADLIEAGTAGFSLLDLMKKYTKVIFLDAVKMGKSAGSIGCYSADQVVASQKSFSLHEMGLAEVIKIGKGMGEDFKHVIILGIQPEDTSLGEDLSEVVQANIPKLISKVIKEM